LDHESRASDQVPLLLMMKEDRLALQKAVDSGDTDLGMLQSLDESMLLLTAFSVSCLIAVIQSLASGDFLPFNRGRRFEPGASKPAATSVCKGAELRDAPRLLLFR